MRSDVVTVAVSKPQEAIDARINEGLDTDYELYKVIDKSPGNSIYGLAKHLNWSSGKVHGSVRRLEKDGLVHTQRQIHGGRTVLRVFAADWSEFFTPEELDEFQNMEF